MIKTRTEQAMKRLGIGIGKTRQERAVRWIFGILIVVLTHGSAKSQPGTSDPCGGRGREPSGKCRDQTPLRLPPPPSPSGLSVTSTPSGAKVQLEDGTVLGTTPFSLTLARLGAGTYRVTVSLAGYEDASAVVEVGAGAVRPLHVKLARLPVLSFIATDDAVGDASIWVDGQRVASMPKFEDAATNVTVRAGKHRIFVKRLDKHIWTDEVELQTDIQRTINVGLLGLETGLLSVGGTTDRDLIGVEAYLDPPPFRAWTKESPGRLLGKTPIKPTPIAAGKHVLVLSPEGVPPRNILIEVLEGGVLAVAAAPPSLATPVPDDRTTISLALARQSCAEEDVTNAEGCVVAGHESAHPSDGSPPDLVIAEHLYRQGCLREDAHACYSLGYLRTVRGDKSLADEAFKQACVLGSNDACWARYMHTRDIPDPTQESGRRSLFPAEAFPWASAKGNLAAATVGIGPYAEYPIYAEASAARALDLHPRVAIEIGAALRFRMFRRRDAVTGVTSTDSGLGPGFDLGVRARLSRDSSFTVYGTLRGTEYFGSSGGASVLAGVSCRFGERQFSVGALLDRVATRFQRVMAFGGQQLLDDSSWRPMIMLSYGQRVSTTTVDPIAAESASSP
jgi:hypothetical protein